MTAAAATSTHPTPRTTPAPDRERTDLERAGLDGTALERADLERTDVEHIDGRSAATRTRGNPVPPVPARRTGRFADDDIDEFFAPQRSTTSELPDPEPLLRNLAHCAIEALAGARELDQLARWVTDEVYRRLQKRVVLAARSRRARGVTAQRPVFTVGRLHRCEPADGIIEAVLIVQQRHRFRAVAIRLEGFDTRWRASVIAVL